MKTVLLIGLMALLAGCAGVNTGRKSTCFGQTAKADGTYIVSRNAFQPAGISSKGKATDDCDFESF